MFNKSISGNPVTWTEKMLKEFVDILFTYSVNPGTIPFLIRERVTTIALTPSGSRIDNISYRGILASEGFDNVCFGLSADDEMTDCQNCVGYLELLNGRTDGIEPVPMIRGFIKQYSKFFEKVNALIRDAKIFNLNNPIVLNISIDLDALKDINTCNILETKLRINTVEIYQKLSLI